MSPVVPVASMVAALALSSAGVDLASPAAFVRGLYAAYRVGGPDYLDRDAAKAFAPPLLDLIRRYRATTPPGEVGILDWAPICDCQDDTGMTLGRIDISPPVDGRVTAAVRLHFGRAVAPLRFILVKTHGAWRIYDVVDRSGSLKAHLQRELDAQR